MAKFYMRPIYFGSSDYAESTLIWFFVNNLDVLDIKLMYVHCRHEREKNRPPYEVWIIQLSNDGCLFLKHTCFIQKIWIWILNAKSYHDNRCWDFTRRVAVTNNLTPEPGVTIHMHPLLMGIGGSTEIEYTQTNHKLWTIDKYFWVMNRVTMVQCSGMVVFQFLHFRLKVRKWLKQNAKGRFKITKL